MQWRFSADRVIAPAFVGERWPRALEVRKTNLDRWVRGLVRGVSVDAGRRSAPAPVAERPPRHFAASCAVGDRASVRQGASSRVRRSAVRRARQIAGEQAMSPDEVADSRSRSDPEYGQACEDADVSSSLRGLDADSCWRAARRRQVRGVGVQPDCETVHASGSGADDSPKPVRGQSSNNHTRSVSATHLERVLTVEGVDLRPRDLDRPHRVDHDQSCPADLQPRAYTQGPDPGRTGHSHKSGQARVEPWNLPDKSQEGRGATEREQDSGPSETGTPDPRVEVGAERHIGTVRVLIGGPIAHTVHPLPAP